MSSGHLGSINHTILSLEALKSHGLELHALAYNLNDESQDELISKGYCSYLKAYLATHSTSVCDRHSPFEVIRRHKKPFHLVI